MWRGLTASAALLQALAGSVAAESSAYGSFTRYPDLPGILFLTGEIQQNDSFELRRAMRDGPVTLVVAASPGGNLYEGLQIAAILHDNGIGTYVPEQGSCESSCANIFLGGSSRLVAGKLGVHQFFSGAPDADASTSRSVTTAVVQYTTADIIGIMNQFDTPPFVYEKMFGTTDIYFFTASEKPRLNRGMDLVTFTEDISRVDAFVVSYPDALARGTEPAGGETSTSSGEEPVQAPPLQSMEEAAMALLAALNADWSLPNHQALALLGNYYDGSVDFYGSRLSHAEVMQEKAQFAERWPVRSYSLEPTSVRILCQFERCIVHSIISWRAASPERAAKVSGRSTWTLVLVPSGPDLKIASEDGATIVRRKE